MKRYAIFAAFLLPWVAIAEGSSSGSGANPPELSAKGGGTAEAKGTLVKPGGRIAKVTRLSSTYITNIRRWHNIESPLTPVLDDAGRPTLTLYSVNTQDRVSVPALSKTGGFAAFDLDKVA